MHYENDFEVMEVDVNNYWLTKHEKAEKTGEDVVTYFWKVSKEEIVDNVKQSAKMLDLMKARFY